MTLSGEPSIRDGVVLIENARVIADGREVHRRAEDRVLKLFGSADAFHSVSRMWKRRGGGVVVVDVERQARVMSHAWTRLI